MKTNHGGAREGAGKPALYNKPMKRINVMLDPETITFYKTQGNNLSEGIRNYWRGLTKRRADSLKAGRNLPAKSKQSKGEKPA